MQGMYQEVGGTMMIYSLSYTIDIALFLDWTIYLPLMLSSWTLMKMTSSKEVLLQPQHDIESFHWFMDGPTQMPASIQLNSQSYRAQNYDLNTMELCKLQNDNQNVGVKIKTP